MKLPALRLWKAGLVGVGALLLTLSAAALDGCHLIAGVADGELALGGGTGTGAGGGSTGGSGGTGGAGGTGGTGGSATGGSGGTNTGGTGGAGGTGPTYPEVVLADSPLAYWRLGENTTPTAYDATGNGHDGTFMGGVTVSVPGAIAGDADTAVHFDGSGEVTVGDVFGFEGNEPFSVEAWINPEIDACSFIGKADKPNGYIGWLIYFQGSALTVRRGHNLDGPLPPQNQFTHIVATYDGFTLRQYQNGQLVSDIQTSNAVAAHTRPFTIGRTYEWVAFQGVMDEVAVYGANLPPARILTHYEVGAGLR